jgi:hypothetical protein
VYGLLFLARLEVKLMKINKTNALHLWYERYGDSLYEEDFHGNLMCRDAYGDDDYYIVHRGRQIYCGWNIHHILPTSCGGTNEKSNLLCTNIATNEEAEDKITYWIDDILYQVKKIYGTSQYEIVRLK